MNTIESMARTIHFQAQCVLEQLDLITCWQSIGAEAHVVGSMAMGLMLKHRDIDLHIYSPVVTLAQSSEAVACIFQNPRVKKVEYNDLLDTEEQCIEWHLWYEDSMRELWQIDMIHMVKGSKYDGFFEKVAQRIKDKLTSETRAAILMLKNDTPDQVHIAGIEYYQAVIRDGIRTYAEFERWRESHPMNGIVTWMP